MADTLSLFPVDDLELLAQTLAYFSMLKKKPLNTTTLFYNEFSSFTSAFVTRLGRKVVPDTGIQREQFLIN